MSSRCKYALIASPQTEALSSRSASRLTGISKSQINSHRSKTCVCDETAAASVASGESETHNADGSANYVRFSERPWGYEDYRAFIATVGQDPDKVTFSWGWTSNATGSGFWNKLNKRSPHRR